MHLQKKLPHFTIANIKNTQCPPIGNWLDKLQYAHTMKSMHKTGCSTDTIKSERPF